MVASQTWAKLPFPREAVSQRLPSAEKAGDRHGGAAGFSYQKAAASDIPAPHVVLRIRREQSLTRCVIGGTDQRPCLLQLPGQRLARAPVPKFERTFSSQAEEFLTRGGKLKLDNPLTAMVQLREHRLSRPAVPDLNHPVLSTRHDPVFIPTQLHGRRR
nr:hypothetical protein [Verrucomicrobium spinosum]